MAESGISRILRVGSNTTRRFRSLSFPPPPGACSQDFTRTNFSLRDLNQKPMNEAPNIFAQNDTPLCVHSRAELHDDQLRVLAPSVFAAQPISGVSSCYALVPTAQLVSRLRDAGWVPVSAVEQRIKIENRRGSQR